MTWAALCCSAVVGSCTVALMQCSCTFVLYIFVYSCPHLFLGVICSRLNGQPALSNGHLVCWTYPFKHGLSVDRSI
jgi:hypothetical protein